MSDILVCVDPSRTSVGGWDDDPVPDAGPRSRGGRVNKRGENKGSGKSLRTREPMRRG